MLEETMDHISGAEVDFASSRIEKAAALVAILGVVTGQYVEPTFSTSDLAQLWDRSENATRKLARHYRDAHPDEFGSINNPTGIRYNLDQAVAIEQEAGIGVSEDNTKNLVEIAEEWGTDLNKVRRYVYEYQIAHPEVTIQKRQKENHQELRLTQDQIDNIKLEKLPQSNPPAGSKSVTELAKMWDVSPSTVRYRAQLFFADNPDETRLTFKIAGIDKPVTHLTADQVKMLEDSRRLLDKAPEGSMDVNEIAVLWGVSRQTVTGIVKKYRIDNPTEKYYGKKGKETNRKIPVFTTQQITQMSEDLVLDTVLPEGALTMAGLAKRWGTGLTTAYERVNSFITEQPDEILHRYRSPNEGSGSGNVVKFLNAKQIEKIENTAGWAEKERTKNLRRDIKEFLTDIEESDSLEAQEFRGLVELFGAERASDLLYQLRPEYTKLPVPFVKSALAEYLGDFLVVKGEFSLGSMEKAVGLLVDPSFKTSLIEIVKGDCLRLLNQMSRGNLGAVNIDTVTNYLNHIREETSEFTTDELSEVLNEVEGYYQLLFDNVHKPDYFVDELVDGRQFPDINQRINVQEIAFKQRVLIGDEMGTGKSASAVMAKEILGVKQALIVVPSNVVEVWRDYLSDAISSEGEQVGYFKPGHAPRVLIVEDLETLQNANPDDYDYIIISQERLNEDYTDSLSRFDYGMLIVDEMHKLKNLAYGKRAESLLKLAETIEGDNKYLALLSGTPVPNKIGDVAMSLKLLYPQEFKDVSNKELISQILNGDMLDLRSLLVPRMQMKTLAESVEMPELQQVVHRFELSPQEKEIYEILIEEDELTASEKMKILRQFILNSRLLDATPGVIGSKVEAVSDALHETFGEKDKVVMFVNGYIEGVMRGEDTIFEDLNVPEGVEVLAIDGSVDKERRLEIQKELEQQGRKILLVVSGQTADVGVDFSAAEEVYFYNEPWTEYDKRQQRGRVYRPGLKDDIIIRTFIAAGTIEDGIHRYIEAKYKAVEKLLHGVPISELERQMLKQTEEGDPDLEVSPELAEYYFSSWDKMMKIYGHVKELGEEDFIKFLSRYDAEYAESYANLVGSRSYQANVARLSGTIIDSSAKGRQQDPSKIRILDVASGPEMLKRHVPEEYAESIVSVDINKHHFTEAGTQRAVGSFLTLPVAEGSVDYVNLSLAMHYTNFIPSKNKFERLQLFQELNRVLKVGGQGVISMIYTLQFHDTPEFRNALDKLGFKIVDNTTGETDGGKNFKTQAITLEKVRDCKPNVRELAAEIGSQGLQAFKFAKQKITLKDSRKIVAAFSIGSQVLHARFNAQDEFALEEETAITGAMEGMKRQYGEIKTIPREVIKRSGFSRIFNGRRYVLFKRLETGSGAVVNR